MFLQSFQEGTPKNPIAAGLFSITEWADGGSRMPPRRQRRNSRTLGDGFGVLVVSAAAERRLQKGSNLLS